MGLWFLFFLAVPILELALLIEVGRRIGAISTLFLIFCTALLGAYLARRQGLGALRKAQAEMAQGRLPAGSLADGILILLAGAVLITPGILTDILGFLLLMPGTRRSIKSFLWKRFANAVRQGTARVHVYYDDGAGNYSRNPGPDDATRPRLPL